MEKFKKKMDKIADDINWSIVDFLDHGPAKDGIFANLIVPAAVAFITALFVTASIHK